MRKLTVKNFSVIKEAELEFGKITVLIGPQSSGKSLLCELAYFFGKDLVELAIKSILNGDSWERYLRVASSEFATSFPVRGDNTELTFSSFRYEAAVTWKSGSLQPGLRFSEAFQQQYESQLSELPLNAPSASGAFSPGGLSSRNTRESIWIALNRVLAESFLDLVIFVPAVRAPFAATPTVNGENRLVGSSSIQREFSALIQWATRWKIGLLTTGRGVTDEINRSMTDILQGFVMTDSGIPLFLTSDGRKLPLELLSTGVKQMIPLFNVLERMMYYREHSLEAGRASYDPPRPKSLMSSRPLLYIEEPEADVFPKTQYELVQLFARLAFDPILDFEWVITTHSPYILSAFNNLIEAAQVAAANPELKDEVAKLIPQHYWVKSSDFRAYSIHEGKLESIMDSETGLVSANYLDSVSETIGVEFDELLRLGYVKS